MDINKTEHELYFNATYDINKIMNIQKQEPKNDLRNLNFHKRFLDSVSVFFMISQRFRR
jgi:hypothetical protein